ncbi:lysosome-associated membrane glycoprotein 2 isoform X2 [Notolabrus celidotus]|uniref:lysosome-associated membrane glycoprotein 2 isoform X2 n=1 Tax=Notolabrus celidotus TaxID=1203425 RepID=UPI0014900CB2|nr:lysosome-associated membrane glycoprotein 2 isoform X2 [Notolabrus celidotus]
MYRYAAFVLLLTFGIVFQLSHGVEVVVKDSKDELCIYANLAVNFTVSYEKTDTKSATAEFELPSKVTTDGSECNSKSSLLNINFGGHAWSVNFTLNGEKYEADVITFSYNLSDKVTFPDAALNDTLTVTVKPEITDVAKDTCYSCKSTDTFVSDTVNQTLWNVLMQAFVSNNSKSEEITSCATDVPVIPTTAPTTHAPTTHAPTTHAPTTPAPTTPAPTTHAPTTHAPTTHAPTTHAPTTHAPTTHAPTTAPVTNATTAAPPPPTTTPTPTPTLPTPALGKYSIKTGENGTVCLLADFGLRIGLKQGEKYQEMNFDPNRTSVSGKCGVNSSELVVASDAMTIMLTFTNDTKKFRLHALNITGKTSSGVVFSEANTNLSLWEAAVGASYMCNKEQNYTITSLLTLFTFDLRVQPVAVKKDVFSTAHECSLDDTSILIPIIVGAALAGLILIVVIAYVIGRRKTYVGYQTL